jgi:SAM-dependent methyltransferase
MMELAETCRSCGSHDLHPVLSLGETPLADRLLYPEEVGGPELRAPLELVFCPSCTLVQITVSVAPEELFCRDYPYYSSVSPSLMRHFAGSAEAILADRKLGADSLVVEAASNDGYMLKTFKQNGVPVLGIDPASGPARTAQAAGIETLETFFTQELAARLSGEGRRADVFLANNVLAHVPDLNGFVSGIRTLLKDDGVAVIECPYLVDLLEKLEFDTIYHQHLCYFSVLALDALFRRHGLYLNRLERTPIHGGSLRLFVERRENVQASVRERLAAERAAGVDDPSYYAAFAARVMQLRHSLTRLLGEIKAEGGRIAGYGAAAKATTLMSYCGIGRDQLDYIVDLNPHKQGRYTGGNHLEILPPDRLAADRPDYLLILAWNFADEIMAQQAGYKATGGRFIVPVPQPHVH